METERRQRRALTVVGILVLVAIVALSGYEYGVVVSLGRQNSSLSSQISEYENAGAAGYNNLSAVVQAFDSHLMHLGDRNVSSTGNDYASNATMTWVGNTQGYGGIYTPRNMIELTYKSFLGMTTNLTYSVRSEDTTLFPNDSAAINANLFFAGNSHLLGRFNGTVAASYTYVNQRGTWIISSEDSNYTSLDVQYSFEG